MSSNPIFPCPPAIATTMPRRYQRPLAKFDSHERDRDEGRPQGLRRHPGGRWAGPRRARRHLPRASSGPNGAGKSTSMRLLTGQAIADEGEITVLGHDAAGRGQDRPRRDGRRPAARQPRRGRHGRGQPLGVRAPLPRKGRGRGRGSTRSSSLASPTGARTRSTSSRAACAGASCSRAAWSTSRSSCFSTSRPSASTRRSAPSSGRSSTAFAAAARRSSCPPTTSRRPSAWPTRWR